MSAMKSAGEAEPEAAETALPPHDDEAASADAPTHPWAYYAAMPIEDQLAAWEKSWAVKSVAAFRRDLPELLRVAAGKWALYVRSQRVRVAESDDDLYLYCINDLHLNEDEFAVCYIHGGTYDGAVEMSGR